MVMLSDWMLKLFLLDLFNLKLSWTLCVYLIQHCTYLGIELAELQSQAEDVSCLPSLKVSDIDKKGTIVAMESYHIGLYRDPTLSYKICEFKPCFKPGYGRGSTIRVAAGQDFNNRQSVFEFSDYFLLYLKASVTKEWLTYLLFNYLVLISVVGSDLPHGNKCLSFVWVMYLHSDYVLKFKNLKKSRFYPMYIQ